MLHLSRIPTLIATTALLLGTAGAQSDPIAAIVREGKDRNQVMRHLDHLTHKIGPRLTGSPTLLKAQNWAMGQFRKFGCTDVRLEKWGEVPVGFERGERQVGRMVTPLESPIVFTTMNWTPGTNGPLRAKVVISPKTMEEYEAQKGSFKGAWVLMQTPVGMRGTPVEENDVKKAVDAEGPAGRIFGARDERVHSHGNWRDKTFDKRPTDLNIYVRKSDYDRLWRNAHFGRNVQAEFDIENKWFKGPVAQYNVIADLKGSEKPDEMVIICGHLDSWNSPGSQGASDNGTGSVVALEAARILGSLKVRPKRTVRFILWSGEEQGLLGSRAYVETHKNELDKISAVLNDDGGSNYQGGYVGLDIMKPMMEAAFAPTVAAFPDKPMEFQTVAEMPRGGSSDHAPFNWVGVPGFFTIEKGKQDYGYVWHTQFDRYENTFAEYLVQSSTNHAIVAWNLANAPGLLPRGPKPAPATAMDFERLDHALAAGSDYWYHHVEEKMLGKACDHGDDWALEARDRLMRAFRLYVRAL